MTNEQRGRDPTATLANTCEKESFVDVVQQFLSDTRAGMKDGAPVRTLPDAERTLDDTKIYPTWKIHMVDAATRKLTNLIVGRPFSESAAGMFGRATRAYIAYDLQDQRLVFFSSSETACGVEDLSRAEEMQSSPHIQRPIWRRCPFHRQTNPGDVGADICRRRR